MILADPHASHALGRAIGLLLRVGDAVTLAGPLGAGKTTLARGVIEAAGLRGEVASPTYPIVILYAPPDTALPIAHVDLYRIDDPEQLDELGLDELRETAALILEWPERAPPFADALALTLAIDADGARWLTAVVPPRWKDRWPPTQ